MPNKDISVFTPINISSDFVSLKVNDKPLNSLDEATLGTLHKTGAINDAMLGRIAEKFGAGATLLQMSEAGAIHSVEFDAVTFIYGDNANHFDFHPHQLSDFADSFAIKPFLRDHNHREIEARDGTILASYNRNGEFVQKIKLTTKRGIESFLQGQIDRFSIGFDYDSILCSVCGEDYTNWDICGHVRGRKYNEQTCKLVFDNPTGIETSAVNIPAVPGTYILSKEISKIMEKEEILEADVIKQAVLSEDELSDLADQLHLTDMDERIGVLEEQNSKLLEAVNQLTAELAKVQESGMPAQFTDSTASKSSWSGYKGSKLQVTDVRKPTIDKVAGVQQSASVPRQSPTERQGASLLAKIRQGGN